MKRTRLVLLAVLLALVAAPALADRQFAAKATVNGVIIGARAICGDPAQGCFVLIATSGQPLGDIPSILPPFIADLPPGACVVPIGMAVKTEGHLIQWPVESTSCLAGQLIYVADSVTRRR